jgi:uncharacterized protein (UPF0333 family)
MRGQITIEYLVIFVILLILFTSISVNLMNESMASTLEVQRVDMIRAAGVVVGSAAESLRYQGSGARSTASIRAPPDCDYTVGASSIAVNCDDDNYDQSMAFSGITFKAATIGRNKLVQIQLSKS